TLDAAAATFVGCQAPMAAAAVTATQPSPTEATVEGLPLRLDGVNERRGRPTLVREQTVVRRQQADGDVGADVEPRVHTGERVGPLAGLETSDCVGESVEQLVRRARVDLLGLVDA